ncbi:MAG TPA: beta-ketoacyl-ACP synthase II [Anaerolineae bacterium]|nr:beta-ketoacyl-ACP synthase II [Anaerolineae bacterium]
MTPSEHTRRRVVITGLGVVTPVSSEIDGFWDALLAGRSGVSKITLFDASALPCQIAGEISDFDPSEFIPTKQARRISRSSQLALVSSIKAVDDAQLPSPLLVPERMGVYFGTAIGGIERALDATLLYNQMGLSKVSPFALPSAIPNMPTFHVTQQIGTLGPSCTVCTACASGTQSVGEASLAIRDGRADVILAGGVESMIQEYAIAGFCAMRALPINFNHDPQHASRPFDAKREGFIFAEGSACMVLESLEHARARKAPVYAEVSGFASSNDGYHIAAPDPTAVGAIRTMAWALADAGIEPEQVDYINAHGTSTPANDVVETLAIKKLFGDRAFEIPISSTKSMLGHAMGASGAIEAVVCALTIKHGIIHPTINYEHPDPECDLDYVTSGPRESNPKVVLSNSFGLGGQNACLVLKKLED